MSHPVTDHVPAVVFRDVGVVLPAGLHELVADPRSRLVVPEQEPDALRLVWVCALGGGGGNIYIYIYMTTTVLSGKNKARCEF